MREKLIRDKLVSEIAPERIRVASEEEYLVLLRHKLLEEADEVFRAESLEKLTEEVADVMQVLKHICEANGITEQMFDKLIAKSSEKGEFSNKIVLRIDE